MRKHIWARYRELQTFQLTSGSLNREAEKDNYTIGLSADGYSMEIKSYKDKNGDPAHNSEWKLQISTSLDNMHKAWNSVVDTLIDYRLSAKVGNERFIEASLKKPTDGKNGKTITVYLQEDTPLQELTDKLMAILEKERINPGIKPLATEEVSGTKGLLFRRNDKDMAGKYIGARQATSYNPHGKPDPFKDVVYRGNPLENSMTRHATRGDATPGIA